MQFGVSRPRPSAAAAVALSLSVLARPGDCRQLLRGGVPLAAVTVRKPLADHRKYAYATLPENGLKVLAVEDERAAKAGFAVAVEAGSFYDPPEFPGLAHFCEHLLFLGTKKYPDEASFDGFMSVHDGSNNAFTEQERTVFYNEVGHSGFDEGMDRFAQFFIEPLFKQELVRRELNAVNSEHQKNIPDQGRRLWEILRRTARPDSVVSRFYTGTVESLHHGDAAAVAALRRYHNDNYCAPRMNLVMVSNMSTADQLLLAKKHFGAVPKGSCKATTDFGEEQAKKRQPPPFDAEHTGQYIRFGTNSTPAMWVMFPMSPTMKSYKEGPMQYLEYMLGYAGPGSLKSTLKKKGLITDLGLQADETSAATLFFVMYDLTPAGATSEGVKEVAESTFKYFSLLKSMPSEEVSSVYASLQKMSQVNFDYSEAPGSVMDAVSDLAGSLSRFPAEDILSGSFGLIDRLNVSMVHSLIDGLASQGPRGASIALAAPGAVTGAEKPTGFEKYYNIHFHQAPIPSDWMQDWNAKKQDAVSLALRAPPALKYVPVGLKVRNETAGLYPQHLSVKSPSSSGANAGSVELWWKGQGTFVLPKAQLRMRLAVSQAQENDARHEVLRRLHAELARQVLEAPTEDFQNCGMSFSIDSAGDGYRLGADGYDAHLGEVVLQALDGMLSPTFGAEELARATRQVTDDLADTTRKAPYQLAMDVVGSLTTDDKFDREQLLAEVAKVDEQQVKAYLASLKKEGLRVQLLVVGNMGKASAEDLGAKVAGRVDRLLSADASRKARVVVADRPVEVRMRNPIAGDANHATLNSYQYGVPDVSERVRMMLLGKMVENPVYDTLRTKKQLGYIVFGFVTEHVDVLELRVLVQGDKELPDSVDTDIEGVLQQFGADLRNMSLAQFSKWKSSIRSGLNHKDQNMGQEADRYWSQIANDGHCFNRKELALQYLEELSNPKDIIGMFELLRRRNRKVSVKMFGANADAALLARPASTTTGSQAPQPLLLVGANATRKRLGGKGSASFYPTAAACSIFA